MPKAPLAPYDVKSRVYVLLDRSESNASQYLGVILWFCWIEILERSLEKRHAFSSISDARPPNSVSAIVARRSEKHAILTLFQSLLYKRLDRFEKNNVRNKTEEDVDGHSTYPSPDIEGPIPSFGHWLHAGRA